jgi:hypothetical protein
MVELDEAQAIPAGQSRRQDASYSRVAAIHGNSPLIVGTSSG